ncbi:hypothetical protein [Cochleicola gelatinilyticus]|uniref:Uncharacterized protein n=1 Tax=Cochleicola gelatinilyticus TaxID=1763537 RepID=A0A167HMT2_9FLAO|nr:hypothetical protein [Cochleicola gelatinilyticus]OAB78780.1 hypothetical protein ULVI_09365 [Cochleicola gelatinilyticus]
MSAYEESIKRIFEKITRKQAFIMAIICAILIFLFFFTPILVDWDEKRAERRKEVHLEELKAKDEAKKLMDSIRFERAKLENEKFLYKNAQIENLLQQMGMNILAASSISIVSVHNGGEIMLTSSESLITVLYTNEFIRDVNLKKRYDNYTLHRGYGKYFLMMLEAEGKSIFIEDVRNYPNIYNGKTKSNMDFLGTKSIIGAYIKSGIKGTYFISVSFPHYYTKDNISAVSTQIEVEQARDRLVQLLDVK